MHVIDCNANATQVGPGMGSADAGRHQGHALRRRVLRGGRADGLHVRLHRPLAPPLPPSLLPDWPGTRHEEKELRGWSRPRQQARTTRASRAFSFTRGRDHAPRLGRNPGAAVPAGTGAGAGHTPTLRPDTSLASPAVALGGRYAWPRQEDAKDWPTASTFVGSWVSLVLLRNLLLEIPFYEFWHQILFGPYASTSVTQYRYSEHNPYEPKAAGRQAQMSVWRERFWCICGFCWSTLWECKSRKRAVNKVSAGNLPMISWKLISSAHLHDTYAPWGARADEQTKPN